MAMYLIGKAVVNLHPNHPDKVLLKVIVLAMCLIFSVTEVVFVENYPRCWSHFNSNPCVSMCYKLVINGSSSVFCKNVNTISQHLKI